MNNDNSGIPHHSLEFSEISNFAEFGIPHNFFKRIQIYLENQKFAYVLLIFPLLSLVLKLIFFGDSKQKQITA